MRINAMVRGEVRPTAGQPRRRRVGQRLLLLGGVLSSLLYVATDALGGLLYPGYSFFSQAISELSAIGAPSEPVVGPLYVAYNLLVVAFGAGLLREESRRSGPLRVVGALLMAYGAIGFVTTALTGTYFRMEQRGAGSLATDAPHLVITGVLVVLLLLAMGFGAFALGKRFRAYSFATMGIAVLFGAWTGTFAARLGAGEPTPGLGLLERVDVYASVAWPGVLALALLRRPRLSHRDARAPVPRKADPSDARFTGRQTEEVAP